MRIVIITLSMCLAALVFLRTEAFGQRTAVSARVEIAILKAEDARRYDKTLEDLLKSPNVQVRMRAALAAGRIGNDAAVPTLATLLEKDSWADVRTMAAFALGEIESIKGADIILRTLNSVAPDTVRARAVEAAGKIAAANAKGPKAAELGKAILAVFNDQRGEFTTNRLALTAVLRARPTGAEEVVRKFLAYTDPALIADALNTLARLQAKNSNRDARDLLKTHVHAIVRANAARLLGAAEDKESVDVLIKAATSDSDSRVRVAAIRALASLKDAKAAEPLVKRGEVLLAAYKKAKKPNFIPAEHSEFLEIATALGRLLTNTGNQRAVNLFRYFGQLDRGFSPEVYIARLRIAPRRGEDDKPELTSWRQYSTLAQIVGEFATLEPTTEEGKRMKEEAPVILRELAKAYAEADPIKEADTIMAGPDVLRAYAGFKTSDLGEILRDALKNKDVFIRATAAELLGELPASRENTDALNTAFGKSLKTDKHDNDAQLAILDALFKLDKRATLAVIRGSLQHQDYLVRKKALDLLKDKDAWKEIFDGETRSFIQSAAAGRNTLRPYDRKSGTKLGQVLNSDADYRRALARKNGNVRAILTTQKGTFTINLLPEDAPLTVDNFIKLARANYFNGLEVHRVVPNFVMQDGDPRGDGNGGPGWSIRCEINMVPYERGAVGMALSGKDTGGSQWFVTHSPQPHLDGGYTVFGRVNETGMRVVDKIVRGDRIISVRIIGR
jgi:cyclophilin family peptidyl-prolyl cis-trans isomerase/HEAT repeat protein